jgi:hypothetical protein
MSLATAQYRAGALAALAGARAARARGDNATAATLAQAARAQAALCRGAALLTSFDDVDDVQAAEAAASEAEDYAQPAAGGARSTPRYFLPGGWRQPGWRTQVAPAADERAQALATLDKIAARASARRAGQR